MKKLVNYFIKVLAFLLVLGMIATSTVPALAVDRDGSTKYTDGLLVDGSTGWNSSSGDDYLLAGDFDVTITFENTPFLTDNEFYHNFVFEIFGGEDTQGITLRADAYGWNFDPGANVPSYEATFTWDWKDFVSICKNNPMVTLNLKKTSDTVVKATIHFGTAATEVYTVTYSKGVPASMRVRLGSDGGSVKVLECRNNVAVVKKDDLTIGGFRSAATAADHVSGDFSVVYRFHNASQNTAAVWNNFVIRVWGTSFEFFARADAYGWGENGLNPGWVWDVNDWDFNAFQADMANADVTVAIDRIDDVITLTYDITASNGNTYHIVGKTAKLAMPYELDIHLTGEQVVLSNIEAAIYDFVYTGKTEEAEEDENVEYGETLDRVTVHDPSIVKAGDTYYVFGSHMAWAKSTDLMNWTMFTNNINLDYRNLFKAEAAWASHGSNPASSYDVSGNLWAPDVIWNDAMQKWCMYMSVNGDKWYTSIALLTADNIEGPYTYVGPVVYSGFTNASEAVETDLAKVIGTNEVPDRYLRNRNGNRTYSMNAIDPCVTYDESGNLWMSYGSWFGGIYMLKLDNKTGLRDYTYTYETKDNVSDAYQGIKLAGGDHSSGEAPYFVKIGNWWYLFLSYGGLTSNGGYNMRVFRSASITGPYTDLSGDTAILTAYNNNVNGTIGNRLMSYYQWNYMSTGYTAQGHNSVLVDDDGRAYAVYHTRFNDGSEGHQVRVHQLFANEEGWLVAAPFEYTGEKLLKKGFTAAEVAGSYEVLFHTGTNYGARECVTGSEVVFAEDGTLSGAMTGTWAWGAKGSPYVTLTSGGKTYKGVFIEQKMEERDLTTLCFTVIGSDEISVWGYQYPYSDEEFIQMAAENLNVPIGTFGQNIDLPAGGLYDVKVTWTSGNTAVITDDGKVTVPDKDTVVTLTATLTCGNTKKNYEYPVKVFSSKEKETERYLLWEYFTGEKVNLSSAKQGDFLYRNPFNASNVLGVSVYNGVSIEFEVSRTGAMQFLSNILSINAGSQGGLYFTGGSYLGYNATGGFFDANVDNTNWVAGKDLIGSGAKLRISLLPIGFEVYVNDVLAYTQADVGGAVPGSLSVDSYVSVLNYLRSTATDLNFGWGSWWDGGFNGTITNVKLYVEPAEWVDTSGYVYYEDYNNTADTGWISPNAQGNLSMMHDGADHKGYVNYAADGSVSGNRGAYTNFPAEANVSDEYTVEVDIKMTPGNVADRSVSQFAITGTDADYGGNYNNGIVSGYILKLSTAKASSNEYFINDGEQSVMIPSNTWVHIKATVTDGTEVLVELTVSAETKTFTTQANGSGELKGMYLLRGRGSGAAAVDNITVAVPHEEEPTPPVAPAVTVDENGNVILSSNEEGVTLYYSFDGKTWLPYTGSIAVESSCTIYMKAVDADGNESEIMVKEIKVDPPEDPTKPTEPVKPDTPATGDGSFIGLAIMLLLTSAALAGFVIEKKYRANVK